MVHFKTQDPCHGPAEWGWARQGPRKHGATKLTKPTRPGQVISSVQGAPSPAPSGPAAPRFINVQEAKTRLSALLARVAAGEHIVLARHGKPIAQLVPLDSSPRRQLGFLRGSVGEAFFKPLPDDEIERWCL
jgi:prevent-host-death family protein